MAGKASAKRKAPAKSRGKAGKKKPAAGHPRLRRFLVALLLLVLLTVALLTGAYHYGSVETRMKMEGGAVRILHASRSPSWMPAILRRTIEAVYDQIPASRGVSVDIGERPPGELRFLAGPPVSREGERLIAVTSPTHTTLFQPRNAHPACIVAHINSPPSRVESPAEAPNWSLHPRFPRHSAAAMTLGKWTPYPLLPAEILSKGADGPVSTLDAMPMQRGFAAELWLPMVGRLLENYARRFDEIYVYTGPIILPQSSKLSSGVPIADGFFLVIFDQVASGAWRSMTLLVPADTMDDEAGAYLSSINRVEELTGLDLLPALPGHGSSLLRSQIQPRIW